MRAAGFVVGGVVVLATVAVVLATRGKSEEMATLRAEQTTVTTQLGETRAQVSKLESDLSAEQRRTQRAEVETAKLTNELAAVREQLESAQAAAVAAETPVAVDPLDWREVLKSYPAYKPEGLGDALATVEWEVVAESMSNMPPLIAELATHLEEGKPMTELPAETIGSIQRFNGPLVTTAMRLSQGGVVGTDVNGAFSHPGFMSNALAATLVAMEMPLSTQQSAKLGEITADYAAREAKRAASYEADAYKLEQIVDESRLKHAYFAEVYKVLTPEQHLAVRPEAVRGRLQLDIFCESLVWAGKAGPMVYTDRADLTKKASNWALSRGQLPDHTHEAVRALIADWVDALPEDALTYEADGLSNMGMLHVKNTTASAGHVLAMFKIVDREVDLNAEERQSLRAVPGSIVFYRKASN